MSGVAQPPKYQADWAVSPESPTGTSNPPVRVDCVVVAFVRRAVRFRLRVGACPDGGVSVVSAVVSAVVSVCVSVFMASIRFRFGIHMVRGGTLR